MRRSLSLLVALVVFTSAPGVLAGPSVQGTRFEVEETAHTIEIEVDRGQLKMVVQRTVSNPGNKSDQALFSIAPPTGAVATRLRTLGADKGGAPLWFEGELMEAEEAAKRYRELTGIGGYYPKDPALLSWRNQSLLYLQVFPVLAHQKKTVEYTLEMPLAYRGGAYHANLAALGGEGETVHVRVRSARGEDTVRVNGVAVEATTTLDASVDLDIELAPRMPTTASLSSIELAPNRHLVHQRFDVAPRLGEIPRGAAIAVVIDASKSMKDELPLAIKTAQDFVARFPDAKVDVISFARNAELPFARSMSPADAAKALGSWDPKPANGSEVERAIAKADALLAGSFSPAKRMLVITDRQVRAALDPAGFGTKSGALVHIVSLREAAVSLEREDEEQPVWSALPRKTGGLLWHAALATDDTNALDPFEELARPMRIDHFAASGASATLDIPEVMAEGASIEQLAIEDRSIDKVTFTGELWSKSYRATFAPTAAENKRWSGFVFGSPVLDQLSEDEMMPLAKRGRVVSPVTSYLAIEPGVRPSTEGLEWDGVGGGGGGAGGGIGLGHVGSIGHGSGRADNRAKILTAALSKAAKTCAASGTVKAVVENTVSEIVDVRGVEIESARDAKVESCIVEELWAFDLPTSFFGARSFELSVSL